jgi:hypothetical protein
MMEQAQTTPAEQAAALSSTARVRLYADCAAALAYSLGLGDGSAVPEEMRVFAVLRAQEMVRPVLRIRAAAHARHRSI